MQFRDPDPKLCMPVQTDRQTELSGPESPDALQGVSGTEELLTITDRVPVLTALCPVRW